MKENISLRVNYSLEKKGELYFHIVTFDDVKIRNVILQPKAEALATRYNLKINEYDSTEKPAQ